MTPVAYLSTLVGALLLIGLSACSSLPLAPYDAAALPPAPDYSQPAAWAALPDRDDAADQAPAGLTDQQATAQADVFFLHPTTLRDRKSTQWNGDVYDADLRTETDESPIKYQATIFNGVGRVYAPYYRQANIKAYYSQDTVAARRAFALAYTDVKAAFQYYLDHYNQGRPIIIASHSQGTTHGRELVREFFDGKPLAKQLVAAYLVGIPVFESAYTQLRPCPDSLATGCIVSWRTWRRGRERPSYDPDIIVTNPINWRTDTTYAPASANAGTVLYKFDKVLDEVTDAQVHRDILWARKPKFFGDIFFNRDNYHIGDYNLYYLNIRNNAAARLRVYLKQSGR